MAVPLEAFVMCISVQNTLTFLYFLYRNTCNTYQCPLCR
ncbi:DUF1196 domain-containing protein [Vibrio anguillarum]|nr:DUF1196 domain-containing protein [Vibrio anguillarum]MVC61952.1 DUF1196 domain-containing protein [Vibrio cholerae]MVE82725.1 DUF1196 domain-containing protein [Vibrio cholerae]